MNRFLQSIAALFLILSLMATRGFAQDREPAPPAAAEEAETSADQEVEINEDNYRQFMELKDAMQQRTVLPENAYKSQAGLQKLDKLPETSQKHLRNQLREVIVEGEQWKPGDEDREYPFVPSAAAATDPGLRKQETEAWGELVDGYHAREADIHANASRTRAAAAAGSFETGDMGHKEGSKAGEESRQGGGQTGESPGQQQAGQNSQQGGYSPGTPDGSSDSGSEGTSQNALEFLQQRGNIGSQQQAGSQQGQAAQTGSGQAQTRQQAEQLAGQLAGQSSQSEGENAQQNEQAGAGQMQQTSAQADNQQQAASDASFQVTPPDSAADSSEGASQNALEFLMQQSGQDQQQQTQQQAEKTAEQSAQSQAENAEQDEQAGAEQMQQTPAQAESPPQAASDTSLQVTTPDSAEDSTEGVSQNALEFLMQQNGQDQQTPGNGETQSGTLTIQDLVNARGTSVDSGVGAEDPGDTDKQEPGEIPPKKDGDG